MARVNHTGQHSYPGSKWGYDICCDTWATQTTKACTAPLCSQTLTGNIQVIWLLNQVGHDVSYSQLEENDTALCLQKLTTSLKQRVALPAPIKLYVLINLGWDNIDELEETLTGKGTSHWVNGIAVQANIYGPCLPALNLHVLKRRSKHQSVLSMKS